MAKRQEQVKGALDGLFTKTETAEGEAAIPAEGYTRSTSVGLKESEIAILDQIAEENGVRRNAVMRFLLRWAMAEYKAGRLAIPTTEETTRRVNLP